MFFHDMNAEEVLKKKATDWKKEEIPINDSVPKNMESIIL
jgi:hypothetical protein